MLLRSYTGTYLQYTIILYGNALLRERHEVDKKNEPHLHFLLNTIIFLYKNAKYVADVVPRQASSVVVVVIACSDAWHYGGARDAIRSAAASLEIQDM